MELHEGVCRTRERLERLMVGQFFERYRADRAKRCQLTCAYPNVRVVSAVMLLDRRLKATPAHETARRRRQGREAARKRAAPEGLPAARARIEFNADTEHCEDPQVDGGRDSARTKSRGERVARFGDDVEEFGHGEARFAEPIDRFRQIRCESEDVGVHESFPPAANARRRRDHVEAPACVQRDARPAEQIQSRAELALCLARAFCDGRRFAAFARKERKNPVGLTERSPAKNDGLDGERSHVMQPLRQKDSPADEGLDSDARQNRRFALVADSMPREGGRYEIGERQSAVRAVGAAAQNDKIGIEFG